MDNKIFEFIKIYIVSSFYLLLAIPQLLLSLILATGPLFIVSFILYKVFNFDGGGILLIIWLYIFIKMEESDHWYTRIIHKISPF